MEAIRLVGEGGLDRDEEAALAARDDLAAFAPLYRYTASRCRSYLVEMSGNRYLTAQTYSQLDYEYSRQVLDQMMQTLRLISP